MTDGLVQQLREFADDGYPELSTAAADRIEALTAERDEAINQLDSSRYSVEVLEKRVAEVMADNARLRNALTGIKRAAAHRMQDDPKDLHSYYFYTARTALTGKADQAVAGAAPVTTADMVKDLREKTGAGMVDAKRALTECLWDMDEAVEWLRFKGTSRTYIPKHKRLQAVAGAALMEKSKADLARMLEWEDRPGPRRDAILAALTGKEPRHE